MGRDYDEDNRDRLRVNTTNITAAMNERKIDRYETG